MTAKTLLMAMEPMEDAVRELAPRLMEFCGNDEALARDVRNAMEAWTRLVWIIEGHAKAEEEA